MGLRNLLTLLSALSVFLWTDGFAQELDKKSQPEVLRVIYGSPLEGVENFNRVYQLRLLKAALDASGQRYELIPAGRDLVQSRLLKEIAAKRVDVYWSMTSVNREQLLQPIRIPLDKGLNGWRVMLVRKSQQDVFANIRSLEDLARYVLLQGHDWPDTSILKFNGLLVDTRQHHEQLFDMLRKGRAKPFLVQWLKLMLRRMHIKQNLQWIHTLLFITHRRSISSCIRIISPLLMRLK